MGWRSDSEEPFSGGYSPRLNPLTISFRVPTVTVSLLASLLFFAPLQSGERANAAEKQCDPKLRKPPLTEFCVEVAPYGNGISAIVLLSPRGELQSWILTPKHRTKLPGIIAFADKNAVVYLTFRINANTVDVRLRTTSERARLLATFSKNNGPIASMNGHEGAISPRHANIALFLAYRSGIGDDARSSVAVINVTTKHISTVPITGGFQDIGWESETQLHVGTRLLKIDPVTGEISG